MDKGQTKGNLIQGRIKSQKDGMFITSIPFDKGFEDNDRWRKGER